jgi:hypothetical protein
VQSFRVPSSLKHSRKVSGTTALKTAARPHLRTKSLVVYRARSTCVEEEEMEPELVPSPKTIWELSTMTEEQIQALATRGPLKRKAEVAWRLATGEAFPTEGTGEAFLTHVECGFRVPTDDFFRELFYFNRIDLVHLVPNAITIVSSFIHLCEAYLGIPPHFHLWQYFFELKKTRKDDVVGSVGFMLHWYMKPVYIDLLIPDNTTGWKQGWFYLDNPAPVLPTRSGYAPVPRPEWSNQVTSRETDTLKLLLDDLERLKTKGLFGGAVAISFSPRRCGDQLQSAAAVAHPRSGAPRLRVPGSIRSHRGRTAQGLQGGDGGAGEEHYSSGASATRRVPRRSACTGPPTL